MNLQLVNNKYVVGNKLGQGKFGVVYEGTTLKTNIIVAIKYADNDSGLVKHEATILNYLYRKSVKHVPFVIWYGMDTLPTTNDPVLCLIMPKYDYTLTDYMEIHKTDPHQHTAKLCKLLADAIYILKSIHEQFVIHRDIKPDNFMVKDGELYLIDFGLSQIFIDETGEHIPQKYGDSIMGAPLFISTNIHLGSNPSRRDDVLSLSYVFLQLFSGKLVWECENSREYIRNGGVIYDGLISTNHPNNKRIYFIKKNIGLVEDYMIMPNPQTKFDEEFKKKIIRLIKYCDYMDYADEPEYDVLIEWFVI